MAFISVTLLAQSGSPVAPALAELTSMFAHTSLLIGLLGIGLTLLMVFKSNLTSRLRVTAFKNKSRSKHAGQSTRKQGASSLQRLAKKFDHTAPALATELRYLGRS